MINRLFFFNSPIIPIAWKQILKGSLLFFCLLISNLLLGQQYINMTNGTNSANALAMYNGYGEWHLSAPRSFETNHPFSIHWRPAGGSYSRFFTISNNGNVGIGNIVAANAQFQLSNTFANRKFVLYEGTNNDHQFFGIGVNSAANNYMRYQVNGTASDHIFFAGTSSTTSTELMRIKGNGNVGIGTSTPSSTLHLRSPSSTTGILLDDNWAGVGEGGASIGFANSGVNTHEIEIIRKAECGFNALKIGNASNGFGMYIDGGRILFGTSVASGNCGNAGLSGTYQFYGQSSSTSLLVSPTTAPPTPYPTIPSGYILSVQGNGHVSGNLGIGTTSIPSGYIAGILGNTSLNGRIQVNNTTNTAPDNTLAGLNISNTTTGTVPYSWIQTETAKPLALNPISNSSYVAIGFSPGLLNVPTGYKLAVDGKIICTELKVKASGNWPDYVFSKDYSLMSLDSVETFIQENNHLPEIPSAAEIQENGINSGEMDQLLMKKVEELTLYMIAQKKEIELLKEQNKELNKKIDVLSK